MNESSFSAHDTEMMALALKLAQKGRYTTTPNPNVGCVITDSQGNIVGQGWHQQAGTPHAEVHALREAGEKAKGGTAYVTLEPCSHYGRTPPCAQALVEAGVARVVSAMVDPNPLVAGRGINILRENSIVAEYGLLGDQANQLNHGFLKRMRTGLPFVQVKLAASLDGKTALANGESKWITGASARQDVQLHRAQACAILTGSGTVLADDPSLNVRMDDLPLDLPASDSQPRQPLRIILDGRNQLDGSQKIFSLAGDTLVINLRTNPTLATRGIQQWQAPELDGKLDLSAVMQHLGTLQLNLIWVEAGAKLAGVLLEQQLIDELILYQAPKLMGNTGKDLFEISQITSMNNIYDLAWRDVRQLGKDIKLVAEVNYPASNG